MKVEDAHCELAEISLELCLESLFVDATARIRDSDNHVLSAKCKIPKRNFVALKLLMLLTAVSAIHGKHESIHA